MRSLSEIRDGMRQSIHMDFICMFCRRHWRQRHRCRYGGGLMTYGPKSRWVKFNGVRFARVKVPKAHFLKLKTGITAAISYGMAERERVTA